MTNPDVLFFYQRIPKLCDLRTQRRVIKEGQVPSIQTALLLEWVRVLKCPSSQDTFHSYGFTGDIMNFDNL